MTYLFYYYIRVNYVMCAISWDRCSLIGLLVVMSVVVVLVLFLCEPSGIPNARSHIVKNFMVLSLA